MNPADQVLELLQSDGAVLIRGKKHEVYKLSNGQVFTRAATPSDRRAAANQLSELKRLLGLTKTEATEGARRERKARGGAAEPKFRLSGGFNSLGEKFLAAGLVESELRQELDDARYYQGVLSGEIEEVINENAELREANETLHSFNESLRGLADKQHETILALCDELNALRNRPNVMARGWMWVKRHLSTALNLTYRRINSEQDET